jgi:adenylate cyclase
MGRRRAFLLLSGLTALWVGLSAGWPGPRLRVWERNLDTQLLQLRGARTPPEPLVLVTIDDATLQQGDWFEQTEPGSASIPAWARGIGVLPWPRAAYGRLAEALLEAGAAAVAINVVFEGPSARGAADDAALVAALARYPGRIALAAEWLEPHDSQGAGGLVLVRPEALQAAVPATLPLGVTNLLQPRPGQPLRHPEAYRSLLASQGVDSPPSLALRLLQLAGRRSRQPDADRELHSYGPEGQLRRIPAWEVLDPQRWARQPLRPAVRGALVLVGPVVSQGEAGHSSPFGALSGLEVLGTAVANSLEGDGLATWPAAPWQRALLAAGTVALAALLALSRPSLGWRLAVVSVALALQLLAVALALTLTSRWLQLLAPASGLVVLGLISSGDAYLREGRERRRLRRTFERYVAPSVVAEILADPAAAEGMLRGRVREVTVLFADLQGFTDLTRRRSAAGESELHVRQLNTYLGAMVEVISAHGGTVDKFIGDAVMAVFGSPVSRGVEQEAAAAVRCALAMRARLEQLNAIWREQGVEPLASGVGLASGVVLAGQIGSPQRLEFTVIGDTVNLASRLESLTRRLPSSVCIDTATARLLSGDSRFVLRSFGLHEIKGLEATEVFAVEPAAGLAAGACAAQPPS